MRHEEFNKFLDEIIEDMRATLGQKSSEYSTSQDKLVNFKEGALALGTTPSFYLLALMEKHMTSIRMIAKGIHSYSPEKMREKCGDARNYLVLLEALMFEANK